MKITIFRVWFNCKKIYCERVFGRNWNRVTNYWRYVEKSESRVRLTLDSRFALGTQKLSLASLGCADFVYFLTILSQSAVRASTSPVTGHIIFPKRYLIESLFCRNAIFPNRFVEKKLPKVIWPNEIDLYQRANMRIGQIASRVEYRMEEISNFWSQTLIFQV